MTTLVCALTAWALLAAAALAFNHGAATTRQRIEGGRPEDAS